MIGLCRGGSVCLHYLLAQTFRFRPSVSSSTALMSFLFVTSSEVMHPGSSLLLSPFLQKGGMEVGSLGMSRVASRGFSSPPAQLRPAGEVEEPLVARSVHASSLLSPRFIRGLGIQELFSCGGLLLHFLSRLVLPPHLCTLGEVLGRENLRGFFLYSRLPLLPHLCTLGEVVGRLGLPSAASVRVLPGLPIFGLGGREGTLSPLLVKWLSCAIVLLMLSLRLPCSVQRSGRCGRGSSRLLFSLVRSQCDRWRSTEC